MATIPERFPVLTLMRLEQRHVAPMLEVFANSAKQISKDLKALESGGNPLSKAQMEAQYASISAMMEQDFDDIEAAIQRGRVDAARVASGVASRYENTLLQAGLTKSEAARFARSQAAKTVSNLDAALARMSGSSYKPLSKQIYDTKKLASGWLDSRINQALASGWDARRFAKEFAGSFDPKVPGGVSYAANRLARTEINNAYHAASADRYMKSPIVQEISWSLSSSHPDEDICNDLARNSPYPKQGVPAKPHPHCYCYITPVLPTEEEFLDKLFAGEYGDEPWAEDVRPDMQPSKVFPGMSKGEEDAVARYTRNSFRFNDDLRHGKKPDDTALLDSAFQHASLERATTVRRVVAGDPARNALSEAKNRAPRYVDQAFMSTQKASQGTLEELIDEFGNSGGPKVVFEIKLPKGAKAIDISGKLDEHPEALGYNQGEVLLPRGMQFKMGQPHAVGDWRDGVFKIILTPIWDSIAK